MTTRDVLRFFLVGVDGKQWAFGSPGSPVRLAATPEGLQGAPFHHDWQQITGMDGELYRGTVDQRAAITLKLWVADPRSSAWARHQHALWRESLGRGKRTCRLYVVSKESGYWWLDVRPESVAEANHFGQYPGMVGETGETVQFTSDRSFWRRFTEIRTWDRTNYHGARLANLGDQPAWLRWHITGQHSGVTIGIGTDTHHLPYRASGYLIDTDELWPTLMSPQGADLQHVYPTHYWKRPLPGRNDHKGAVPLTIRPTNPGSNFRVDVSYVPQTEQAW